MSSPYNPLDIDNLGESIQRVLLGSTPTHLPDVQPFVGAGVYALYYVGDLSTYSLLADANRGGRFGQPIYVGKAVPEGARRGVTVVRSEMTRALSQRIVAHRHSVTAATNLNSEDFYVRWLVVEPVWIPLGESLLISRFAPVWNTIVDGFGNNAPGSRRVSGTRSRWDTLHPGRTYAIQAAARHETAEDISADVQEYLRVRLQV